MFGWLEKLLVKGPVLGSGCAGCEGKKQKLREMQAALTQEELAGASAAEEQVYGSGSYHAHYTQQSLQEEYRSAAADKD